MTIEEIRAAKRKAEEQIKETLQMLVDMTGLKPVSLNVRVSRLSSSGTVLERGVYGVSIELESI